MSIQVAGSLIPGSTDTPLDPRTRIQTLSEIESIAVPYIGMKVYVIATKKTYRVTGLKSKQIGAAIVENGAVGEYELDSLDSSELTGAFAAKTHKHTLSDLSDLSGLSNTYAAKSKEHTHANASVLNKFSFADGKLYYDGAEVILSTSHTEHEWSGGVCTVCGLAHTPHTWSNGVCSVCGAAHSDHEWSNGVCSVCGAAHSPHTWSDGACPVCGLTHSPHEWSDGVCTVCGLTHTPHTWSNGVCSVCGKNCTHNWVDSECTICGKVCTNHTWSGGTCTICGAAHSPHTWSDGVCSVCGATPNVTPGNVIAPRCPADSQPYPYGFLDFYAPADEALYAGEDNAEHVWASDDTLYLEIYGAQSESAEKTLVYSSATDTEGYVYNANISTQPECRMDIFDGVEGRLQNANLTLRIPFLYAGNRGMVCLSGLLPEGTSYLRFDWKHTRTGEIVKTENVIFDWNYHPLYERRPPGDGKWIIATRNNQGVTQTPPAFTAYVYTDDEWIKFPPSGIGPEYAGHPWCAFVDGVSVGFWICDGVESDPVPLW